MALTPLASFALTEVGTGGRPCTASTPFLIAPSCGAELGRGACVNATAEEASDPRNAAFYWGGVRCECGAMWTGKADMFTTNGFGCDNPVVLDKLCWAISALLWTQLLLRSLRPLMHHARKFAAERLAAKRAGRAVARDAALSMAAHATQVALVFPCVIVGSVWRAASNENIGVDVGVTIPWIIFYAFHLPSYNILSHLWLKSLVAGVLGTDQRAILRLDWVVGGIMQIGPTATIVACLIAGIAIPPLPSPARVAITVLRNVAFIVLTAGILLRSVFIRRELQQLTNAVTGSSDRERDAGRAVHVDTASPRAAKSPTAATSSSPPTSALNKKNQTKLQAVVKRMHETERATKAFLFLFCGVAVLFSVPQLMLFQYVALCLVLWVGVGRANIVWLFNTSADGGADGGENASSSPSPGTAAAGGNPGTTTAPYSSTRGLGGGAVASPRSSRQLTATNNNATNNATNVSQMSVSNVGSSFVS